MAKLQSQSRRLPFTKSILIGVIILAVAAVIIAWMDETGVDAEFLRIFENARR